MNVHTNTHRKLKVFCCCCCCSMGEGKWGERGEEGMRREKKVEGGREGFSVTWATSSSLFHLIDSSSFGSDCGKFSRQSCRRVQIRSISFSHSWDRGSLSKISFSTARNFFPPRLLRKKNKSLFNYANHRQPFSKFICNEFIILSFTNWNKNWNSVQRLKWILLKSLHCSILTLWATL